LVSGWILDTCTAAGAQKNAYYYLAAIILIFGIAEFISLSTVFEPTSERPQSTTNFWKACAMPLKNPAYRMVLLLGIMWQMAQQIGIPYLNAYVAADLGITYLFISIVGFLALVPKIIGARIWGTVCDRKSNSFVTRMTLLVIGISYFLHLFLVPENAKWLYPALTVLSACGQSGLTISIYSLTFDYAPLEGRSIYVGVKNTIAGLFGFVATLIGAAIVDLLGNVHLTLFNFSFGSQQILMGICGLLTFGCSLWTKFFVEPHKTIVNEADGQV